MVGLSQVDAEAAIVEANLTVGAIRPKNSTTVPRGTVIDQSLTAGTTVPEGSTVELSVSIADDPPVVAIFVINPADSALVSGLTQQYTATGTLSDGTVQDLTDEVKWESTKTAVAGIAPGGQVRGFNPGTTTIQASKDGIAGSTGLTVGEPNLVSIEVTPADPLILVGEPQPFTALGVMTNGTRTNLTGQVTWDTSLPAVAAITGGGQGIGVGAGITTIGATVDSITGTTTLNVEARFPGTRCHRR